MLSIFYLFIFGLFVWLFGYFFVIVSTCSPFQCFPLVVSVLSSLSMFVISVGCYILDNIFSYVSLKFVHLMVYIVLCKVCKLRSVPVLYFKKFIQYKTLNQYFCHVLQEEKYLSFPTSLLLRMFSYVFFIYNLRLQSVKSTHSKCTQIKPSTSSTKE